MRASLLKDLSESADAITRARMEFLLVDLATTKREPTDTERTFLEDNVPLMQAVAEEITRAPQEAPASSTDA